jgi:hypothetical protein
VRRPPLPLLAGFLLAALPLAAACGREPLSTPDVAEPIRSRQVQPVDFPAEGLRFELPGGWAVNRGQAPLVATAGSGGATISVWRYVRSEKLPRAPDELREAQTALIGAAERRDPTFTVRSVRQVKVDGAPAIQILGTGTIDGARRDLRSTHVYAKGAEVVVDAFATQRYFERTDRLAFRPLLRSLKIDPPRPAAAP